MAMEFTKLLSSTQASGYPAQYGIGLLLFSLFNFSELMI